MSSRRRRERKGGAGIRTPEQFVEAVRAAYGGAWRGRPYKPCCVLCGAARVVMGGVWAPSPECQAKMLIPSDKSRHIGYCVCATCSRLPGLMGRVEDAILADFAALAASPTRN